jgi:hypothetical protein
MNRNIKYKQVCKLAIFGNDDINNNTNSQYIVYPSKVNGITINNAGTNYIDANTQLNIVGGGGSGAVATVTTTSGAISSITINNSGAHYIGPPSVTITSGLTNITNLVGGSGYTTANTQVTVSGGGGSGAIITPVAASTITNLIISNAGTGYSSTPTITITSGITGTTTLVAGSGYTNGTYPLVISGGGGSGCTGTFTISSGGLTSISITNAGTGYTSAPTLSFPGAGAGTGASATATLGTGASATAVVGTGASASVSGFFTNSKLMRFSLHNALNDVRLSQNAKCVLESCHIPNITNLTGNTVLLRLNASSEYKTFDTSKELNGNPIILTTIVHPAAQSNNLIYNASDMFYSVNVSSNFLSTGYIEFELECPNASSNIDFITNSPLKNFYISLVIVDIDPELTKDLTLAPPIDYNNYNINMPIRPY